MAKYFDPPQDYKPGLILQLRERLEGGDLLPDVRQIPLPAPFARSEAIILIHGFNNHYGEAGVAYQGFRLRQYQRVTPRMIPPRLEEILADLFWPGDAAWGLFDLMDFLVYPTAVGTAKEAAPRLARYLRSMPVLRITHFIGHSLGCRIVLETIDDLQRNGGPVVGKVCLMAAAVPVFKVRFGGELAGAMEHAREVRILHSDDDAVLKYAFPPGQTLASGDEGFFPNALGLYRPPPDVAGRVDPVNIEDAGHGDYWGHSQSEPTALAADHIAEFFRFGSWQRTMAARIPGTSPRPSTAQPREVGFSRSIHS
ncbi:MAG: alpha/beta hydrolase [Nitrospira sp.]|nr:alpha/beta hydrolase [Nitrospira sp.]